MALWNTRDDATEHEKIDYVYERMKSKAFEERANAVWKWSVRALIVYGLFQLYLNPGAVLGSITGAAGGANLQESLGKAIAAFAKPIVNQMVSEMSSGAVSGGKTPSLQNLTPEQQELLRQGLEKARRKNVQ